MTKKKVLHKLIEACDGYDSYGLNDRAWDVVKFLTLEIYGEKGMALLETGHKTYDGAVDCRDTIIYHTLQKWEDGGNTEIGPLEFIKRLEALDGV